MDSTAIRPLTNIPETTMEPIFDCDPVKIHEDWRWQSGCSYQPSVFFLQYFRTHIMTALSNDVTDEPDITLHDEMSFIQDGLCAQHDQLCSATKPDRRETSGHADIFSSTAAWRWPLSLDLTVRGTLCWMIHPVARAKREEALAPARLRRMFW